MIGPQPTNHEALHAEPIGRLLKPAGGGGGGQSRAAGVRDGRDFRRPRGGNRGSLNALRYLG